MTLIVACRDLPQRGLFAVTCPMAGGFLTHSIPAGFVVRPWPAMIAPPSSISTGTIQSHRVIEAAIYAT
jgi:hypothetical protein